MAPGGYGYQKLARKERADRDVAHRGLGSKGRPCSGVVVVGQRRRTAELEEGPLLSVSGPQIPLVRLLEVLRRGYEVRGSFRSRRRREIGRRRLPAAAQRFPCAAEQSEGSG